jgi:hypothetical protein
MNGNRRRFGALAWLAGWTAAGSARAQDARSVGAPASAATPFLQAGAGAVPRMTEAKLRETLNLQDFAGDSLQPGAEISDALRMASAAAAGGATRSKTIRVPAGRYRLDRPVVLDTGVSLVADGSKQTIIEFYGVGIAITVREAREISGFTLRSHVGGQSGVLVRVGSGPIVRDVRCLEFDGTGLQLGLAGAGGVYFATVDFVECTNDDRTGRVGFLIDGLALPNSNANVCSNVFVKGRWETLYDIRGNANVLIGGDAEPHLAGAGLGEIYRIEGIGNKVLGPYIEPARGVFPGCYFRFTARAESNRVSGVYCTAVDTSSYAKIEDLGANNDVEFNQNGMNFPASPGVHRNVQNILPNAGFHGLRDDGMPHGWVQGGSGHAERSTAPTRGQRYCMSVTVRGQHHSLMAYVCTDHPEAPTRLPLQLVPVGKLRGQTVAVGVWCHSNIAGLGAIKLYDGINAVGTARHSGSGAWEFLVASGRIPTNSVEVGIQLRTDTNNAAASGQCQFSEPVFVIGTEIARAALSRPLTDGDSALSGRLTWNPPIRLGLNSATPDVADGNFFLEANTLPTTITDFTGGRAGQEIKLLATSDHTVLAHGGHIVTLSAANRSLAPDAICKLIHSGSRWYEF